MSDLERRGSYTPRKTREQRAYRLVMVSGGFGALAVLGFVLAIAGVISAALPFIALVIAVVSGFLFTRAVGRK